MKKQKQSWSNALKARMMIALRNGELEAYWGSWKDARELITAIDIDTAKIQKWKAGYELGWEGRMSVTVRFKKK